MSEEEKEIVPPEDLDTESFRRGFQAGMQEGVGEAFRLVMAELNAARKGVHDPKGYGLRALMKFEKSLFTKDETPQ